MAAAKLPSECTRAADHTPCPLDPFCTYAARLKWMGSMTLTHRQQQCPECLLWVIWVPKAKSDG